ncbi:phage portal protein (plasmid) [Skermanella sp. TT6]|uniref:Phage portal protein n=1 Tax=Skermanella cutis TaxID=2775420 RepID=A0ABX7BHJ0_9PROT|nr:phage portal protein [Skermanella sp. TT6]QQP93549.1 phage portal protein [Skermanella sp. TT6]
MNILNRLAGWVSEIRSSPENPSTSLANPHEWLVSWLGGTTDSGVTVTEVSAMQSAAVFACVRVIAETVASLPLHLYENTADGSTKVSAGVYHRMLAIEPNPMQSAVSFREVMASHLAIWGNSYCEITRNGRGEAVELWPLPPDRTEPKLVEIDGSPRLVYKVVATDGAVRILPSEDVLHVPLFGDGLKGFSPIAQSRNAIGLSMAAEKFGSSFYRNNGVPGTILMSPKALSDVAAKRIRESFNASHQGAGNAFKTMVLEDGLDVKSLGIPPADAQHLENRRFQLEEIARVFRVPLSFLQSSIGNTFASSEAQDLHFAKYCIAPYIVRIEAEINRKIFVGAAASKYFVKFNLNALMRGVYKDRIDGLTKGIQSGLYTPNEARALEDLPPVEPGDQIFLQQNMAGVQAIADGTAGNAVKNATNTTDPEEPAAEDSEETP